MKRFKFVLLIVVMFLPFLSLKAVSYFDISQQLDGISRFMMQIDGRLVNLLRNGDILGAVKISYEMCEENYDFSTHGNEAVIAYRDDDSLYLCWPMEKGVRLIQKFYRHGDRYHWDIVVRNKSLDTIEVKKLAFLVPILNLDKSIQAQNNYSCHR